MSRIRALVLSVVLLSLIATGCVDGSSTTALSDPAVLPGTVAGDGAPTVARSDADPAAQPAAETPPPGGFVLDIPESSLPAPAGDSDPAGAPADIAFVQRSIETVAEQAYRFEMRFAMSMDVEGQTMAIAPTGPIAFGEADGIRQRTQVDLGAMFEALTAELGDEVGDVDGFAALFGDDLSIETIVDGTVVYLRAPMLGMLGALGGDGLPDGLADLGDGWGMVDLSTVPGLSADDLAALSGAQSGSTPDQILAMLDDLGGLEDLGSATVDGDTTTHYRTVVDIEAALAAGAAELDAFGPDAAAQIDAMFGDGPVIDLYIDDAGDLRRIVMALDASEPSGAGSFSVSTTIDMFDHGGDITIAVPDDAVDLTDAFAELAALAGGPI